MLEKQSGAKPVKPDPVALHKIDISVRIDGFAAESWLNFIFINNDNVPVETSFCIPLAADSVVCEMVYEDDMALDKGCFLAKDKGFELYDQAVDNDECGVLLEYLDKGIFLLRVSNLDPGRQITVRIKTASLLHQCDNVIRYELPLFITPRYVPCHLDWAEHGIEVPEYVTVPPYELSISCNIKGVPFKNLCSPTHLLDILKRTDQGDVELKVSGRDMFDFSSFVLDMELAREIMPFYSSGLLADGKTAILMQFKPEFNFPPDALPLKGNITFMLDCSNSMQGELFPMAVDYLKLAVKWLNPGDLFNICLYGDRTLMLSPEPLLYEERTLEEAVAFLDSASPDMGGSEMIDALKRINATNMNGKELHDIILLTDGDIYNTEEVVRYVKNNFPQARFFTCGVGVDSPQYLVRALADETGGRSETIEPFDEHGKKVLRQISRIFQPRLNNVNIDTVDAEIDFIQTGSCSVYDGDVMTIWGVSASLGENPEVMVSGTVCGQSLVWRLPLQLSDCNEAVPYLMSSSCSFDEGPEVVGSNNSLFAAIPLPGDGSDELPVFRPVPIAKCMKYDRAGYSSMIHEELAGYGNVPSDPFLRCLILAQKQNAEGAIVIDGEPVADTKTAIQVMRKDPLTEGLLAPAIHKAESWLKKNSSQQKN